MMTQSSNPSITNVGIAGAGVMGSSIAQNFQQYGYNVVIFDINEAAITDCKSNIKLNQQALVDADLLTAEASEQIIANLSYSTDMACFADCDIVIESISETLDIKSTFYHALNQHIDDDCLVVSNTSAIPISQLAEFVHLPQRFAGMHWVNPPHLIRVIEVIKGEQTSEATAKQVYDLAKSLDKSPVMLHRDVKGFVFNRLQFALLREALHLVDNGVISVADLDTLVKRGLGFRWACYGPFETADFGGIDTFSHITDFLYSDLADDKTGSSTLSDMVANQQLGLKSGQGFYDYSGEIGDNAIKNRDALFLRLRQLLDE